MPPTRTRRSNPQNRLAATEHTHTHKQAHTHRLRHRQRHRHTDTETQTQTSTLTHGHGDGHAHRYAHTHTQIHPQVLLMSATMDVQSLARLFSQKPPVLKIPGKPGLRGDHPTCYPGIMRSYTCNYIQISLFWPILGAFPLAGVVLREHVGFPVGSFWAHFVGGFEGEPGSRQIRFAGGA